MKWEERTDPQKEAPSYSTYRAKVPGGWLVARGDGGVTFVPDPTWSWDWTKDEP